LWNTVVVANIETVEIDYVATSITVYCLYSLTSWQKVSSTSFKVSGWVSHSLGLIMRMDINSLSLLFEEQIIVSCNCRGAAETEL